MQSKTSFKRLLRVEGNNMFLEKQGLDIIQNIYDDNVAFISFEGQPTRIIRTLFFDSNQPMPLIPNSSIWVSTESRIDQMTKRKVLFLQTYCNNEEDKPRLHLFNSVIANLILLNIHNNSSLSFLTSIESRILLDKHHKAGKNNLASIVGLIREEKCQFQQNTQILDRILSHQGIKDYVKDTYEWLGGYKLPLDKQITKNQKYLLDEILNKTSPSLTNKTHSDVMYGPVLKSYIQCLVHQINLSGMIIIRKAQQDIQVDQGYHAFTQAIARYHQLLKNSFRDKPINGIQNVFTKDRYQAQKKFKEISKDLLYFHRLNEYISKKQATLREVNNKLHDQHNVHILKSQSEKLINKLKNTKERDPQKIRPQIDLIVKSYERQAGGDNKLILLNEYLSQIMPMLYQNNAEPNNIKDNSKQIQRNYEKSKIQNQKLKAQMNKLREQKKCCIIM